MGSISHTRRGEPDRPRDRLARYLAARYATPKALAREIAVSPKAAENLLAGHWPLDLTWAAIVRRFGHEVIQVVFLPEIAPALAALHDEERLLNDKLAAARARRIQMESDQGGLAGVPATASAAARPPRRASRLETAEAGT